MERAKTRALASKSAEGCRKLGKEGDPGRREDGTTHHRS